MSNNPITAIVDQAIARTHTSDDHLAVALVGGLVDVAVVRRIAATAARLAVAVPSDVEDVDVSVWISEIDASPVVQVDTYEQTGAVRVYLNDGTLFDGDPEVDETPGRTYRLAELDGTDDAAEWITAGHVLDAQEAEWLRNLTVVGR